MTTKVDNSGTNPHINYEPSSVAGLQEAPKQNEYMPFIEGNLGRYPNPRTAEDYTQAGELFRSYDDRHRNDLISNLVGNLKQCDKQIQERMVWHFWHADENYGRLVAEGVGVDLEAAKKLPPLPGKPAPGTRLGGAKGNGSSNGHANGSGNKTVLDAGNGSAKPKFRQLAGAAGD